MGFYFSKKNLSIYLSSLLLASTSLFADTKKEEIKKLDTVTVVGSEASNYVSFDKPSINRTNIDLEDSAKSIQVFNEDFLEDYQPQSLEDIIKMSSNTTYEGNSHGRSIQIGMRGFSNVPILIDSMKITNSTINQEIYNLQSLEVLKGPSSLQYGQSSPGGIVNLVKKKPQKQDHAEVQFKVDEHTAYTTNADFGGGINSDASLRYRVVTSIKHGEDYTNSNTDINRFFIAPTLAYDLNDNHTFSIMAEYLREKTPSSFGTFINSKGDLIAPVENLSSHPDEEFKKTQKIVGFDLNSNFDTWNSNFKYRYIDYVGTNGDVHMPQSYDETTNRVKRVYAYQKQEFSEHALQYTLNKELNIFNVKNNISLGADYNKAYSQTFMHYDPANPYFIDLSHPDYEDLTSLSDHPGARDMTGDKTYTKSWGIFLQDSIHLTENLIFNAGLRYSESKPKDGQKSDATTPSLGLVYKLTDNTSIYTNYSESFTPSTNMDEKDNILDPEEGKGYELGIKQKFLDDKLNLTAAIFKIEKENVPLVQGLAPNTYYKASGKQQSQGIEFDLAGQITPNLAIVASYGYTKTKDLDNDNNRLKNIPTHTANIFTTYHLSSFNLPNTYIGGGARFLGSRYTTNSNDLKLDSEIIYNATVGYKKGNWKASLTAQNLTDEEYVEGAISSPRVYAGTPRTIMATISYKF
ncbi:TonB-dependent siderophore receptor [Arcobacter sp. CECT 8983]|uniref:TonB-dependent siderophore receptor n=1 Tax=Arcobacter sp. CECT 8983 TaxID=2044508 RepID=UPI00100B9277|nr:TonB-dependent receptor [Arcobacter sp. CECT 8983]RXJ90338.1 TonB-dependent siderophore receptor [Arcobacter sp. CECT 8983]